MNSAFSTSLDVSKLISKVVIIIYTLSSKYTDEGIFLTEELNNPKWNVEHIIFFKL